MELRTEPVDFWLVAKTSGNGSGQRYPSLIAAMQEAKRKASAHPGQTLLVLQAVGTVQLRLSPDEKGRQKAEGMAAKAARRLAKAKA